MATAATAIYAGVHFVDDDQVPGSAHDCGRPFRNSCAWESEPFLDLLSAVSGVSAMMADDDSSYIFTLMKMRWKTFARGHSDPIAAKQSQDPGYHFTPPPLRLSVLITELQYSTSTSL